jgi:demethylmenaquinone methyltransferase / 2-methoxy-6-polyprenyl-1,4-benzoquinol methylase
MRSAVVPGTDVRRMFDRIAHGYDRANRVMSAGVDRLWRRKAIRALLEETAAEPSILDLGAGTLDGAIEILRRKPKARVYAADFSRAMLVEGKHKAGAADVFAQVADARALPYGDATFDGAFSAFCVRNVPDLGRAVAELRRTVRPGGRLAILEFFRPRKRRAFWDGFYGAHVLPLLGGVVTGDREAYRYLPASIGSFLARDEFEALLRSAGFADVAGRDFFPGGMASLVVAA